MVCEQTENRLLASDFLGLIVSSLVEQLKTPAGPEFVKEVMARPEEVLALVTQFLPGGLLLFGNSQVVKGLKRDVEATLSMKV